MAEVRTELQRIAIESKDRVEKAQFLRAVDTQWLDSRMAGARMNRCLALIQRETQMEKDNQEKTDHAAIVNARAEREMALAREIELEKRRAAIEEARRQLVRENDPELKELAFKLRAGYVCRDRRRQIADNEYRRLQEKIEDRYNDSIMQRSLFSEDEAEAKWMREDMDRKTAYRTELWRQMSSVRAQKQSRCQEKIVEKKLLDDMLKGFEDEDLRQLEEKRRKMKEMQCEMVTSLRSREEWREERRKQEQEREERVRREAREIESRQSGLEAERERKFKLREELNMKMSAKVLAEEQERRERMDLITELQEQEYLERNVQLDTAEKVKEESVKTDNKTELTRQMEMKKEARKRDKQSDVVYRNQMAEKMAAEEEKEKEKQRKRKEMMQNYSNELMQQIVSDRKKREEDRLDNDERNKSVFFTNTTWGEEVCKEREKLISEHAPHVLGYLQPGVLKHEDVPSVKAGALRHPRLAGLDVDSLVGGGRQERRSKCNEQCRKIRYY